MKNVLIILDGKIATKLIEKVISLNSNYNHYDVVYMDDNILPKTTPFNFLFYKFDPTSYSKLSFLLNKELYQDVLILLNSKDETIATIDNINTLQQNINITVYDQWDITLDYDNIKYYKAFDVLVNGLVEHLPNIPVFAQNIGLRQGEIMEIKIPFGSNFAYRYIGSITQKDWRIVALYRDNKLLYIKPSLVLKPNDTIIAIGKPDVLIQVYNTISKLKKQFPMPFGSNMYLYIDMYLQEEKEILNTIDDIKILHKRMDNKKLIVKITRPSSVDLINLIKEKLEKFQNTILEFDYHNMGMQTILTTDKIRYDIGVLILTKSLLRSKRVTKLLLDLKVPIFKKGDESIITLKNSLILINDSLLYEQISPILFDISNQLKIKLKILDIDPMGDKDNTRVLSHLNNLSKIFNQDIIVVQERANPIKRLNKEKDILQILPLKEDMFEKRSVSFFNTNSDLLSFDSNRLNQILIPVIDELKI